MAYGTQNDIGIGNAQVLNTGRSNLDFVQQLNEQKQRADQLNLEKQRYNTQQQEKKQANLYGLIGDTLNPRDFNNVINDKVKQAQADLAAKFKDSNLSYGDAYLMAQNKAAELGKLSDSLNRMDQQIALTKKEYEPYKRIDTGTAELVARKKILDQLNNTGNVDENVNYLDQALNENPHLALKDKSDYTFTDLRPEELQPLKGDFSKRVAGRTVKFGYEGKYTPAYYDVKKNGETELPTITTKSQPSGFKDNQGNDIPMLSQDAYHRFILDPSNGFALNLRLRQKYGNDINLQSPQAEKLRRIEAYRDVEMNKPQLEQKRAELQPNISIRVGSGADQNNYHNAYTGMQEAVSDARSKGISYLTGSALSSEQSDLALASAAKKYPENKLNQDDIKVGLDDAGKVQVFYSDKYLGENPDIKNPLITTLDERETNVKGNQPFGVKTKKAANAAGNVDMKGANVSNEDMPKMYEYNGKTFNEQKIATAALQSGLSLDQYLKKHPEIKIK